MTKFTIKDRWNGSTLFEREANSLKELLIALVSERTNLIRANLIRANLSGADLSGADLIRANLSGADLSGTNLSGANLSGADLSGTNLIRANLSGADLSGTDLSGTDLSGADWAGTRDDFVSVLNSCPAEVSGLRTAIVEGRIDGSTYTGACACLVGTIANVRGESPYSLPDLAPNNNRPAERFFLGIRIGDTPESNPLSKLAVEWIDAWSAERTVASVG